MPSSSLLLLARRGVAARCVRAQSSPSVHECARRWASSRGVDGRVASRTLRGGFSQDLGKHPQMKVLRENVTPQRVPGTTKVQYTNKKGRTFSFAIPVGAIMNPPQHRTSPSPDGWRDIDTSFCDLGDLDDDMPSPVDECLRACRVAATTTTTDTHDDDAAMRGDGKSDDSDEGMLVRVDLSQLRQLHGAFVQFCRDYVLMDTAGMKMTTMMASELNGGPDYELYDRKTMRRRYWLAIRHRFDDVKELLWPSSSSSQPPQPLLSAAEMLQALVWVEAASAMSVRRRHAYDVCADDDFAPLSLQREVQVLARRVRDEQAPAASHDEGNNNNNNNTTTTTTTTTTATTTTGATSSLLHSADNYITCAALCANHGVAFSSFFGDGDRLDGSCRRRRRRPLWPCGDNVQAMLQHVPRLQSVRDALRVMSVMQRLLIASGNSSSSSDDVTDTSGRGGDGNGSSSSSDDVLAAHIPAAVRDDVYGFSDAATGRVRRPALLHALASLCDVRVFGERDCMQNVDAHELCTAMRFAVDVYESNTAYLSRRRDDDGDDENSNDNDASAVAAREALVQFAQLTLARCRQLLYRSNGAQTTVMSGDATYIPLIDLQAFAEHTHPQALVHYKVGKEHAQGLRFAALQTRASVRLLELAERLRRCMSCAHDGHTGKRGNNSNSTRNDDSSSSALVTDLAHHIEQTVLTGGAQMSLADVTRVLRLLGAMVAQRGSVRDVHARYARLLRIVDTAIGVQIQLAQQAISHTSASGTTSTALGTAATPPQQQERQRQRQQQLTTAVVDVLEGLARCRYTPSSYRQVEMVLLRLSLSEQLSLADMARALAAVLCLVGPRDVSSVLQHNAAAAVVRQLTRRERAEATTPAAAAATASATARRDEKLHALRVLRLLRYCRYASLPSLVLGLRDEGALVVRDDDDSTHMTATMAAEVHCATAMLLASTAAALQPSPPHDNDDDATRQLAATLHAEATTALTAGLQSWHNGSNSDDDNDEKDTLSHDVVVDCVTTSAALGRPACATLRRLVGADERGTTATPPPPSSLLLHSCCTPHLAVSVLGSLEALDVATCAMRRAYDGYLSDVLQTLLQLQAGETTTTSSSSSSTRRRGGGCDDDDDDTDAADDVVVAVVALPASDLDVAVRLLALTTVTDDVTAKARRLLQREIARLDAASSSSSSSSRGRDDLANDTYTDAQARQLQLQQQQQQQQQHAVLYAHAAHVSFETRALQQREQSAHAHAQLLHYCAALQMHHQQQQQREQHQQQRQDRTAHTSPVHASVS